MNTDVVLRRSDEIRSLTGLRGIAAVLVMVYHWEYTLPNIPILSTLIEHGYLYVDLFFIMSGFVMGLVYGNTSGPTFQPGQFRTFILHRIARVYPLYFLVNAVVLMMLIIGFSSKPVLTINVILSNLVMVQTWESVESLNSPAWSISTEWMAYLLFPVLAAATLRSSRIVVIALTLACFAIIAFIVVMVQIGYIHETGMRGPLDLFAAPIPVLRCLVGFTLGLVAWRLHQRGRLDELFANVWAELIACTSTLLLLCIHGTDMLIYPVFMVAILCLGAGKGPVVRILSSKPLHFLGVISYAIYLLHFRAYVGWLWIFNHLFNLPILARHAIATASMAILIVYVAWVANVAVEKPARRMVRRWLEPTRGIIVTGPSELTGS